MPKKAVIACQVLYDEIMKIVEGNDIKVELLPQGLHDCSDNNIMKAKIQNKIDALEAEANYEYIILGYGYCSGGVEGLVATKAHLVISLVHDCIPLLLGELEKKESLVGIGTYYLSRGWIECGGDPYKQHLFLLNRVGDWVEKFREILKSRKHLTAWFEKDNYSEKMPRKRSYSYDVVEYITCEYIKNYKSITLIDNGNLDQFHIAYAREAHNVLDELMIKQRGWGLKFSTIKGSPNYLMTLLNFEYLPLEERDKYILITPPHVQLGLKKVLLGK